MRSSKRTLRSYSMAAVAATVLIGGGLLWAQPSGGDAAKPAQEPSGEAALLERQVELSPREMLAEAERRIQEMQAMLTRVVEVQQVARKHKDVIRLNCVNDKLLQVKQLLNIAESARNDLVEAAAAGNEEERYHQYSQITISHEKASVLRDEADACVGEELSFLGPTSVDVDAPAVADDPTREPPFDLPGPPIDRPPTATPAR